MAPPVRLQLIIQGLVMVRVRSLILPLAWVPLVRVHQLQNFANCLPQVTFELIALLRIRLDLP